MISPLSAGFGLLTHGIDAKVRAKAHGNAAGTAGVLEVDTELGGEDAAFSSDVLEAIRSSPGSTLSQLRDRLQATENQAAILSSILAEARYEDLVYADPPASTDPGWHITKQGEARLNEVEAQMNNA